MKRPDVPPPGLRGLGGGRVKRGPDRRAIATRIARAIRGSGVSQSELARRLGKVRSTLTGWQNGRTQPSLEDFARLCRLVRADSDVLLGLSREGRPSKKAWRDASGPVGSVHDQRETAPR